MYWKLGFLRSIDVGYLYRYKPTLMATVQASLGRHRNKDIIVVRFEYDKALINRFRQLSGATWSNTLKSWYLPDTAENRKRFGIEEKLPGPTTLPAIIKAAPTLSTFQPAKIQPRSVSIELQLAACNAAVLPQVQQHLVLKGYSSSTQRTYLNEIAQLLKLLGTIPAENLQVQDIKRYLVYCYEKLGLNENTLHSRINALKFYYEQVLGRDKFFWPIPRPKKRVQLPRFFNQDEIASIINATQNLKHKVMLMLAYSSGLRVSEVVAIKTNHVDSKRMCILIEQSKGKKDRMVNLSPVLLVMLREYWKTYKPSRDSYLFVGQNKEECYSTRSLQLVLQAAKEKAGVLKAGSVHALRHSFATHLLDKGTDVTMIMKLLGHNDIKTTLRYLHITNRDVLQVVSPLDGLNLK